MFLLIVLLIVNKRKNSKKNHDQHPNGREGERAEVSPKKDSPADEKNIPIKIKGNSWIKRIFIKNSEWTLAMKTLFGLVGLMIIFLVFFILVIGFKFSPGFAIGIMLIWAMIIGVILFIVNKVLNELF